MEKFIKRNEKETLKLLKRIFGIKSIAKAIEEEEKIKNELERKFKMEIELINWNTIKENYVSSNGYTYARYLTLRTIINQYLENKKLYPYYNDLKEIENGQ